MYCLYINLDHQVARRASLEDNFRTTCPSDWRLWRVRAVEASLVGERWTAGSLRKEEKACFLSHLKAIELSSSINEDVLIAEDDALFARETAPMIEHTAGSLPRDAWDMLFTDVSMPCMRTMSVLVRLRRSLMQQRRFQIVNLRNL